MGERGYLAGFDYIYCQCATGNDAHDLDQPRLILEAKRELAHAPQSVKQIAHGMGFSDVGYFSRFFVNMPSRARVSTACKRAAFTREFCSAPGHRFECPGRERRA